MSERERVLRERLLATFEQEAREHIEALTRLLLELERASDGAARAALVEDAFRGAHSLKGAARAVNLVEMERVCQAMEGVFSALKRKTLAISPERIDLLMAATRLLEELQTASKSGGSQPIPAIAPLVGRLDAALEAGSGEPRSLPATQAQFQPTPAAARSPAAEPSALASIRPGDGYVRVATEALDRALAHADEILAEKLAASQLAGDLRRLRDTVAAWRKQWALSSADAQASLRKRQVNGAQPPLPQPVQDFMDWNKSLLDALDRQVGAVAGAAQQAQRQLGVKTDALLGSMRQLLLMPCSWLLDSLRPVVRDLARDQGKDIRLIVEGDAIEIDRRILVELKDPFVHLLRNCADHGIETLQERQAVGKPPQGTVRIALARISGNRLEIEVEDDGRGIDPRKVKSAAVKIGAIDEREAAALDDPSAMRLVFQSEVSTSPLITELSGRGLGLAIVRERVTKLGGAVGVESVPGRGATIRLELPVTLATFRGVVVVASGRPFVVPTSAVDRAVRVKRSEIRTAENRETIALDGVPVALSRLSTVLGLPAVPEGLKTETALPALILVSGAARIAFMAEEICQEQEVLVKSLGEPLRELALVTGACVLGDGRVAPILDGAELIRAAIRAAESGSIPSIAGETAGRRRRPAILVAEDSITSRTLLKNILEAAEFDVQTAVDGIDAYTKLLDGQFDLVVSDVDMPRLDGLALTARIRAEKKLAATPVVLVTSLDSREDRERGIDVGANAYIVKRSFEQSNLLEVVRRLL